MRTLHSSSSSWLSLLPTSLTPLKRTVENIKDPLYRWRSLFELRSLVLTISFKILRARGQFWCEVAADRAAGPGGRGGHHQQREEADEPPQVPDRDPDQGDDPRVLAQVQGPHLLLRRRLGHGLLQQGEAARSC